MDERDRATNRGKNIVVYCQNSNGNPQKQCLTREAISELEKEYHVIAVFDDIRCQNTSNIDFPGYSTILKNDQKRLHLACGTCVIFPNTWTAIEFKQRSKEGLIVELLTPEGKRITIASIYNHPENYVDINFIEKLKGINEKNERKLILVGDFNCAAPEFGSRTSTDEGKDLVDKIINLGLNFVNNSEPTFISRSTGNWNILDLCFVSDNLVNDIISFNVGEATESDHFPVLLEIKNEGEKESKTKLVKDWRKFKNEIKTNGNLKLTNERIQKLKTIIKGENENTNITSIRQQIDDRIKEITKIINDAKISSSSTEKINPKKNFKIKRDTREIIKERKKLIDLIKINKNSVDVSHLKARMNNLTRQMRNKLKRDKYEDYEKKVILFCQQKIVKRNGMSSTS